MVHEFREEVNFGFAQQLAAQYPLSRLHHISRRFTKEYDSRTPSDTAIKVFQTQLAFTPGDEQTHLPKIVHLRAMQTHQVLDRLEVELHVCDDDTYSDEIHAELAERVNWIANLVFNVCTTFNNVSVRLIVDLPRNIVYAVQALRAVHGLTFCAFAGKGELLFQGDIGEVSGDSEVQTVESLGTWSSSERKWAFDYDNIAKCESAIGLSGDYDD